MAIRLSGGGGEPDESGFLEWSDVIVVVENNAIVDWRTQFGASQTFAVAGTDVSIGVKAKLTSSTYRHFGDIKVGAGNLTIDNGGTFEQSVSGFTLTGRLLNEGSTAINANTVVTGSIENNLSLVVKSFLMLNGVSGGFTLASRTGAPGDVYLRGGMITGYTADTTNGAVTITDFANNSRISGYGWIGSDFNWAGYPKNGGYLVLNNTALGTIDANVSGQTLTIATETSAINPIRNDGVLAASNGGTLNVNTSHLTQGAAGVIRAEAGSKVALNGTQVSGGTIDGIGTGVVQSTNSATSLTDVTITARATFDIGRTTLFNGSIVNRGRITNSEFDPAYVIGAGGVTLTGGGTVRLVDGYYEASIIGQAPSAVLTNVDNKILGVGAIGPDYMVSGGTLTLINKGLIGADNDTVYDAKDVDVLSIDGLARLANTGTLEARNGARLEIKSLVKPLENKGGTIQAVGKGSAVVIATQVDGGTVKAVSGGLVDVSGATLNGLKDAVTLSGSFLFGNTTLLGRIVNGGILANGSSAALKITPEDATLSGGGTIRLLGGYDNSGVTGTGAGSVLRNLDNTIIGVGGIGGGELSVVNQGRIVADRDAYKTDDVDTLTIDGVAALTNKGAMQAQNGAKLIVRGIGTGTVQNAGGTIQAVGKGAVIEFATNLVGGTLGASKGGSVTFAGSLVLDGQASPVTLTGNLGGNRVTVTLKGSVVNKGALAMPDAAVSIGATTTLTGGGSIEFYQGFFGSSGIFAAAPKLKLINVDNLIHGSGPFGGATGLAFSNGANGRIVADRKGETLVVQTGNTIANAGVLAAKGGILDIRDKVVGAGRLEVTGGGTLIVDQGVDHRVVFTGATADTLHLSTRAPANGSKGFDFTVAGMGVGDRIRLDVGAAPNQKADFTFTAKSDAVATLTSAIFLGADGKPQVVTLSGPVSEGQFSLVGGADGAFGYVRLKTQDGTAKGETLKAAAGGERVIGLGGDDILIGGAGNDVLDGSRGTDTVSYAAAKGGVKVSLETKAFQAVGGGMGKDSLIAVENLTGSAFADTLTGNGGANTLIGGAGNDGLKGQGGADILNGGKGVDALYGGADAQTDTFVFLAGDSGTKAGALDRIYDFRSDTNPTKGARSAGSDLIDLRGIDGDLDLRGDQKLRFVDSFTKAASGQPDGQVSVVPVGTGAAKTSLVQIDWNGDSRVDMSFEVMRVAKLTADDFLL